MKRILLYLTLACVLVISGSCRKAAEKARKNIRIEAVEKFELHGMTGADVVLRVMNDTGYKLSVESAQLDLFYSGSLVGTVRLREGVELDRRTTASVAMQWQLRVEDPLSLFVVMQKIKQNDLADVAVSYAVKGRGGPAKINISREMVPASEFLNTFGLTLQNLGNYLKN